MRNCRLFLTLSLFSVVLTAGPIAAAAPDEGSGGAPAVQVDFERHIMGLLGRMGCNAGACHGSFQGKGGLYLSLFGYSPEKDHETLTRYGMGRRVSIGSPDESLMLLKATGQVSHGGGRRFAKGSQAYQVVRRWIAEGARWKPGSGVVKKVEVTPKEHRFDKAGEKVQLKVIAEFEDGTKDDVTAFCTYRVNDDYVADVASGGVVEGFTPGDTAVVIGYRSHVLSARVLVPNEATQGKTAEDVPEVNYIDHEVFAKLRKLNIVPSALSSDTEFIRRVYIDTIGTLPTPEEVRAFLADKSPDKRAKKIDELLAHPMHAALWATKFSDITGNNIDVMENPQQMRPKWSKMWHDWFRKRITDNMPYDQIVHGVLCATSREGKDIGSWTAQRSAIEQAGFKGFDTDYAKRDSLDLFWKRNNFTIQQMAEHTAAAFMGVRIECAQCHKHPFDRWSQNDYRSYANLFAQVRFGVPREHKSVIDKANASLRSTLKAKNRNQVPQLREVYITNSQLRPLPNIDTNGTLNPGPLGGQLFDTSYFAIRNLDAREALYQWLVQPENPYFARSFVNRVWGHYTGVGIVHPIDDFSVANPPSNDKLLNALAKDFAEHNYDIRHIERTVLMSRTYQLSAIPNKTNMLDRRNYARAYPRRMMAEVMVDVLNNALGVTENFGKDVPPGARAIEVAPNRVQSASLRYVFEIFGRPARGTTCDCERPADPALPQTLYLMTDQNLINKINTGRLKKMLDAKMGDEEVLDELFLACLSRLPNDKEKKIAAETIAKRANRQAGFVDLVWAIVNMREFILNH